MIAAIAAAVAVLGLAVDFMPDEVGIYPLDLLVFLPMGWWAHGLMWFEPGSVRLMAPVTFLAAIIPCICLAVIGRQDEAWVATLVVTVIASVAAVGSRLFYMGSLLQREGPSG